MKKIQYLLASLGLVASVGLTFVPASVGAINVYKACDASASTSSSEVCQSKADNIHTYIKDIVNTILYITGAVAVLVIIVSGLRYITSAGNAAGVKAAKDSLTYAIVGLIVAVLAYTIVNFVLSIFIK